MITCRFGRIEKPGAGNELTNSSNSEQNSERVSSFTSNLFLRPVNAESQRKSTYMG